MFPDLNQLQAHSANQPILETVNGPIKTYMNHLADCANPLQKIASDFADIDSIYYSKSNDREFNLKNKRLWSVMLNASLLLKEYYETVTDPTEQKLLLNVLSALKNFWDAPRKFSDDKVSHLLSNANDWLDLYHKSGNLYTARSAIQAFQILNKVSFIALNNQSTIMVNLTRPFMPSKPESKILAFTNAISQAYPQLEKLIQYSEQEALLLTLSEATTPIESLESIVTAKDRELKKRINQINIKQKAMTDKLAQLFALSDHLKDSDFTSHTFFSIYNSEQKLTDLLNALHVPPREQPAWKLSLEAHNNSGKNYLYSNLSYYTSGITGYVTGSSAIKVSQPLLKTMLNAEVRRLARNSDLYDKAYIPGLLSTLERRNRALDTEKALLQSKSELLLLILSSARKLPPISIMHCPQFSDISFEFNKQLAEEELKTTISKAVFGGLESLYYHSRLELAQGQDAMALQKIQLQAWLLKIGEITPLIEKAENPKLNSWYEALIQNVFSQVIPNAMQESLAEDTASSEKIQLLSAFHDKVIHNIQEASAKIDYLVSQWDDSKADQAIAALRKHIASINPEGFWTQLIMFFSPSYKRCVAATQEVLHNYDTTARSAEDCLADIDGILKKGTKETKGWIGAYPVNKMKRSIELYRLFRPAPESISPEISTEVEEPYEEDDKSYTSL